MTRINAGIKPSELIQEHLLAEHREIKRIPNVIKKGNYSLNGIPDTFRLGAGHVKFFYDKLYYLFERYEEIYAECVRRGYNVTYYGECFEGLPDELLNDYTETQTDRAILIERLRERVTRRYGDDCIFYTKL